MTGFFSRPKAWSIQRRENITFIGARRFGLKINGHYANQNGRDQRHRMDRSARIALKMMPSTMCLFRVVKS
jgi:hypothetical protein